jgi:hypothetical protein
LEINLNTSNLNDENNENNENIENTQINENDNNEEYIPKSKILLFFIRKIFLFNF